MYNQNNNPENTNIPEEARKEKNYYEDVLNFTPYMYDYSMPRMSQMMYDYDMMDNSQMMYDYDMMDNPQMMYDYDMMDATQMMANYEANAHMGNEKDPMSTDGFRQHGGSHRRPRPPFGRPPFGRPPFFRPPFFRPPFFPFPWWWLFF
ncbi:hypothetical protein [Clostridium sp.]|uniref:hypothetical protein n=1 Tax=Clostridium sp. TaxID=1506 RepID=UPI003464B126